MVGVRMSEAEALRAYFDAHMAMHAAIDADKFAAAYVKANQARDRLIRPVRLSLEQAQEAGCFDTDEPQPTPAHTCTNAGTSAGACKQHCGDSVRCWGNTVRQSSNQRDEKE
jgi:hypothetical protein